MPERLPEELPEPPTSAESPTEAVRLAEVLHDLRSPLTSILGYAQMLEGEPGNAGRMASIIRTSANQMLALTKGLLPETDPPDASMRAATPPPAVRFQNQIDVRGLDKASKTPDSIAATARIERARGCFDQNFHPMNPCPPLKKISAKLRFLKKNSSD